ncbi:MULTISPECIES: hypothetical protein [unclassified Pseudomonas]|uniref:hypothetical protein n=1 Tax=unclassified Pseudomonas TaxID=196821 RepID=UPI0030DD9998
MDKEYSIFVNAAAIVLVSSSVRETAVDDLMNSVLLAQLVANKTLQRIPRADWYDSYMEVLSVAWVSGAKRRKDLLPKKEGVSSPLEWVAAIPLDDRLDQQQQIMTVLGRVAALPGSLPALSILRKQMQKHNEPDPTPNPSSSSSMRLLVIVAHSPVSMTGLCLQFSTGKAIDANPWGQCFDDKDIDGCVSARYFHMQLSETLFAPAREVIARKVGAVVGDHVAQITEAIEDLALCPAEEVGR